MRDEKRPITDEQNKQHPGSSWNWPSLMVTDPNTPGLRDQIHPDFNFPQNGLISAFKA